MGGLGLNLTAADTVIFLEHDWNPMNDLQVGGGVGSKGTLALLLCGVLWDRRKSDVLQPGRDRVPNSCASASAWVCRPWTVPIGWANAAPSTCTGCW